MLENRFPAIFVVLVTALGIAMCITGGTMHNVDLDYHLIPWFETYASAGGLAGFATQVGDYNIPYQTIIALPTYLPVKAIASIKAVSCFFDLSLAIASAFLVWRVIDKPEQSKFLALLAYAVVFLCPTVVMNSGYWGQCDSIWVSFCVWSLALLVDKRYAGSFICYGCAFAFKLQAILLLPVFLVAYVRNKDFSALNFLLIPAAMLVLSLPAALFGRNPFEVFTVYLLQTGEYPELFLDYPSIWAFVDASGSDEYYSNVGKLAILTAVSALLIEAYALICKRVPIEKKSIVIVSLVMAYTALLFLPSMHERYSYLVDALVIVAAIVDRRFAIPACGMVATSLNTYATWLFAQPINDYRLLAAINLILFIAVVCIAIRSMREKPAARE